MPCFLFKRCLNNHRNPAPVTRVPAAGAGRGGAACGLRWPSAGSDWSVSVTYGNVSTSPEGFRKLQSSWNRVKANVRNKGKPTSTEFGGLGVLAGLGKPFDRSLPAADGEGF